MADAPLVIPDGAPRPPARRQPWLPAAVLAIVVALVAAGAGWWWFTAREAVPDWDRLPDLVLSAPAGDAFASETPWVRLRLAPLRPGAQNAIRVSVEWPRGSPLPASAAGRRVAAMTAQALDGAASEPAPLVLQPDPGADGALLATAPLDKQGWWRFAVEVEGAARPAEFLLRLPDPNINGPNAVPDVASAAEAEAVFRRGLAATTSLQSVRYTQWNGDGSGNSSVSEHVVVAGSDGIPPALTFRITGGMDAVIIGSTRWIKMPGDLGWQRQEGAAFIPPSEWGDEYTEATGFALLGEEIIDGEPTQIVAFVAPEQTDPRRRTIAWYVWWVGTESGQVRREAMVSRQHYMRNQFLGFNEPIEVQPPDEGGTPAAGTPTAAATPVP